MVAVRRIVSNPSHPYAALFDLVERPEDLEELLALRAITDSVAADALQNISLVVPADRYLGPRAALVMAPFLKIWPSRFSPGVYGVLYSGQDFDAAMREHGYHISHQLLATRAPATALPRFAIDLSLESRGHRDIRRGGAHDPKDPAIYDADPNNYRAAQTLGASLRTAGDQGVWYDSVRAPGSTCYGTFRPAAVANVGDVAIEVELVWNGRAIAEYRKITTHPLA